MPQDMIMSLDELCPFVRKAGKQNDFSWRKKIRKIYDHEFLYCLSGKAYMEIEGRSYAIEPGSLILVKPNRAHSFWQDDTDPANICWVHFDFIFRRDVYDLESHMLKGQEVLFLPNLEYPEFFRQDPLLEDGMMFPEYIKAEAPHYMGEKFEKLVFHFKQHNRFSQLECKTILLEILKTVLLQAYGEDFQPQGKSKSEHVRQAVRFIRTNYFRKLSVSEIALYAGIHEDYLRRCFKSIIGLSLVDYLTRFRVMKAKELLFHSDLSIGDISHMVGFEDIFYFSKVVKKLEGYSPTDLRKQLDTKEEGLTHL